MSRDRLEIRRQIERESGAWVFALTVAPAGSRDMLTRQRRVRR
jgi:hypothetical protein